MEDLAVVIAILTPIGSLVAGWVVVKTSIAKAKVAQQNTDKELTRIEKRIDKVDDKDTGNTEILTELRISNAEMKGAVDAIKDVAEEIKNSTEQARKLANDAFEAARAAYEECSNIKSEQNKQSTRIYYLELDVRNHKINKHSNPHEL